MFEFWFFPQFQVHFKKHLTMPSLTRLVLEVEPKRDEFLKRTNQKASLQPHSYILAKSWILFKLIFLRYPISIHIVSFLCIFLEKRLIFLIALGTIHLGFLGIFQESSSLLGESQITLHIICQFWWARLIFDCLILTNPSTLFHFLASNSVFFIWMIHRKRKICTL